MLRNLIARPRDVVVLLLFGLMLGLFVFILFFREQKIPAEVSSDTLAEILQRDTLIAITDNSSTSYFLYKGQPLGYQYEMLKTFAGELGVYLKIITATSIEETFLKLATGKADLIALDLTVTSPRTDFLSFTNPLSETRQVLIQRKTEGFKKRRKSDVDTNLIRKQTDLAGKTIYIQRNSSHRLRLNNLSVEIGAPIEIVETDNNSDELIAMVAEGEIDFTVADQHVAMANRTWYENIDIETEISFAQSVAWAVRPGSDSLLHYLNTWISGFIGTKKHNQLFRKYFVSKKSAHLKDTEFHSVKGGKISRYDHLIKKHTEGTPFDWRLVASVIYEESRFNPKAQSWAGAYGLTQLMPGTARRFGVRNIKNPEDQIKGGVALLNYLYEKLPEEITDHHERVKYVLACYNIGMSHITDAINLAKKYGDDPGSWSTGEKYLLLKANPVYFNDPIVKSGYARGRETKRFVRKVSTRYLDYKAILPD